MSSSSARPSRRFHFAVVTASWAVLVLLALQVPQSVNTDEAFQLKALQQYRAGESPSPNHIIRVDPFDLTRDSAAWITWWPPSPQLTTWPFVAMGLQLGTAVRVVACLALLAGCLGWSRWWMLFELPAGVTVAASVLLPWMRYSSAALFQTWPEILAFATIPWFLLAVLSIVNRLDSDEPVPWWQSAGAGLFGGSLFWMKYSAVFVAAAAGAMLAWRVLRGTRMSARACVVFVIACAAPIVLLSAMNQLLAGSVVHYLTGLPGNRMWTDLVVGAIGGPALMAGGADTMLKFALGDPDRGILRHWPGLYEPMVAALAVPGGLTFGWLLWRTKFRAEHVAAITLAVSVVCLLLVWNVASLASLEARHLAGGTLASVPAGLAIAKRGWRQFGSGARGWLLAAALFFLAAPWGLYGPASVLTRVHRAWGFKASAEGLYNPFVSATDARQAVAGLLNACADPTAIWYVPDPLTALELKRRLITTEADFQSIEQLRQVQYRGRVRVCALLPPKFEENGKGPAIRASFVDVTGWTQHRVAASSYDLWVATP